MKIKFHLEFLFSTSPKILENKLYTASGLAEWFCDDVNSRGDTYRFFWGDTEEVATVVRKKTNFFIQYKWEHDDSDNRFSFEFRVDIDDLTGDGLLTVTDYVEPDEESEMKSLWQSQIHTLLRTIGS